ncbi:uncharacterized protein XM38_051620 [Halomicronema hongdechloris C2206]|uniref:DUF3464 family protein n=1 Tax=Halomicronema hongdechloris C2206 TaxID=1641165 RepID=A0A1Z3HVL7_9CYAN|nr:PAM68 family protein [Halomicronema hongdechloris]ASC74187.1 uncharacterized protein XM38_051620 [Halomicronema hongdechloris C2206]
MASESQRDPLPFEPKRQHKKAASETGAGRKESSKSAAKAEASSDPQASRQATRIPEVISRRMLRRMLIFSGVPTGLGVVVFFSCYFLITHDIVELPNVVVLLATMGCFGIGVLGLSYGALSSSWEEDRLGGWLGVAEFGTNFNRLAAAWRTNRESSSQDS